MAGGAAPQGLTDEQMMASAPKPRMFGPPRPAVPPIEVPGFFSPEQGTVGQRLRSAGAAVNSGIDAVTLGSYGGLNRLVGDPMGVAKGIDEYRQEHPDLHGWTDAALTGPLALEGPAVEAAGKAAPFIKSPMKALFEAAESAIPKAGANRVAQVARVPIVGAAAGAGAGASSSATSGGSLPEIGEAAKQGGAFGYAFGLPMAGFASGVGMLSDAVLNSKGGQARRFIEERGGKVGVTTPGKGPVFDAMDVEGNASADIGEQARKSGERVEEGLRNYKEEVASKPYRREVARVPEEKASRQVDVTSLYDQMIEARGDVGLRDDIAPKLDRQIGILEGRRQGALSAEDAGLLKQLREVQAASQGKAQPRVEKMIADLEAKQGSDRIFVSEREANELRQKLAELGGVGEKTDAKLSPLKGAYGEAKDIVDRKLFTATPKSGPLRPGEGRESVIDVEEAPYAKANRTFTAGMKDVDESNRLLDLKRSKKPGASEANINKLRVKGQRRGENTVTAGSERSRFDAFTEKHPELGLELERPELLRKQADLSFSGGLPQHGNLYERLGHASMPLSLLYAATQGHGGKAALAMGALLAARNRVPIAGRLLYPGALEGAAAETAMQRLNPLFQAARAATRGDE